MPFQRKGFPKSSILKKIAFKIMNRRIQKITLLVLLHLSLSSCLSFKPVQFKSLEKIKLSLDEQEKSSGFSLLVNNPNSAGIKLRSAKATFIFLNKPIGQASLHKSTYIPANSLSSIPFQLELQKDNLPDLIPAGLGILFGDSAEQIRVQGFIRVRKFLWYKKFNFDLNKKIDLDFLKTLKL